MPNKVWYLDTVDGLLELYRAEMRKLVEINAKRDYSPLGDVEFHAQSEKVYWVKCALVSAEGKARS